MTPIFSPDQTASYHREGYLFLPNLFTAQEVAVLRAELPAILAQRRPEVWREKDSDAVRIAFAVHTYNSVFARLARHPRLVEPAQALLGEPIYIHQFKINQKAAFNGDVWQWHQDFGTWSVDDGMAEPRALNVALFLDDVTEFNGPLMFIPRSHSAGKVEASHDTVSTSYPLWTVADQTISDLAAEHGLMAPTGGAGSALFFSLRAVACQSRQYIAVEPQHRVSDRQWREQCDPQADTTGVHRGARFRRGRTVGGRLPVE